MIKEFFTLPDSDLTHESSVDPMGVQVIWTTYGQAIFSEKLTTIANDLRVFTFNLFHNHLINQLFRDHNEELQEAKAYYKNWQTESDIKTGLLMFLEDLVTWIFFLQENESETEIDKLGILGLMKARNLSNTEDDTRIYVAANKRSGLLKNQINLGMSGRYKGPMMSMNFFDRSFTYLPKTWEQVDKFMNKWTEAIELQNQISKLIIQELLQSNEKENPQISLYDLRKNKFWKPIVAGYLQCFGKRRLVRDIRIYWQDKLGLRSGAPSALYHEISLLNSDDYIDHREIFNKARKSLINEQAELEKIDAIIKIEPLLSHSEYVLKYLSQQTHKTLSDVSHDLSVLREEIKKVGNFTLEKPHRRLLELQKVMLSEGSLTDWVQAILDYHNKIMEDRGGTAWVELNENGTLKHYYCSSLWQDINTVPKYLKENVWLHTYYLETVRSIHSGLN